MDDGGESPGQRGLPHGKKDRVGLRRDARHQCPRGQSLHQAAGVPERLGGDIEGLALPPVPDLRQSLPSSRPLHRAINSGFDSSPRWGVCIMGRRSWSLRVRVTAPLVLAAFLCAAVASADVRAAGEQMAPRPQTFDTTPNWDGHNTRPSTPPARTVTQNFGYKATANAGGAPGEVGGLINPAGEAAYYAKPFAARDFNQPLSASGKMKLDGGGNTLLGVFNDNTVNEWRTPNSILLRLYGRGGFFYAYP